MTLPLWATILIFIIGLILSVILAIMIAKIIAPIFVEKIERDKKIEEDLNFIKEYIEQEKARRNLERLERLEKEKTLKEI